MATVILRQLFDEVEIIRSRETEDFERADIVFDVGGGEFDHHSDQKEYRENGIPYASCGLIWRAFGSDLIRKTAPSLKEIQVEEVLVSVDNSVIQSIDAVDNGFPIDKGEVHIPTVDQMVKGFNPNWNSDLDPHEQFMKAIEFAHPFC